MATKPTAAFAYKKTRNQRPAYNLTDGYIQRVDWTLGRQNITDNYSAGTCTVYGRDITAITGANPPALGDEARVTVTDPANSGNAAEFYGFISDIRRIYGQTANMDTWEITVEGAYGRIGRDTATVTTTAGASTSAMADSIVTATGSLATNQSTTGWGSTTSAQTITGQPTDAIDTLLATEQGFMVDGYVLVVTAVGPPLLTIWAPACWLNSRGAAQSTTIYLNLADDGTTYQSQTAYKFREIEFLSAAQNYGTKVTVQADGFADQTSGTGTYVQTVATINGSATEAANLAGYIKTSLDISTTIPYRVTYDGSTNPTASFPLTAATYAAIKRYVRIKFRGTEYFGRIEGLTLSADASNYQVNLFLSSNLQNAFLTLDSPYNGLLDTNKLGF